MRRVALLVVAFLIAGSGGAFAAGKINGKSIKSGTVTGKQVKNHSLTPKDFRGSVRGRRGKTGQTGQEGPQGPQGPAGAPGGPGLSGVEEVESTPVSVPPGATTAPDANCPAGKRVIGTGFSDSLADEGFVKSYTFFAGAFFSNSSSISVSVSVQAICAFTGGASAASVGHRAADDAFARDVRRARRAAMASAPHVRSARSCSAGYVRARIGGRTTCLHAGEFCARRYQRKYRSHGFKCVSASDGRLRLRRR